MPYPEHPTGRTDVNTVVQGTYSCNALHMAKNVVGGGSKTTFKAVCKSTQWQQQDCRQEDDSQHWPEGNLFVV